MRSGVFRRLRVGGLALTIIGVTLVSGTPPAGADANVNLSGLTKFAHMRVDNSHVFLTSGAGSTSILVTNFAGTTVGTIFGQAGADGIALSPDRTKLYVALSGADAISVIDTATLSEITRYSTGASTCPHGVALAASKIWFSYNCSAGNSQIGSIDTSTDPATVSLALSSAFWYSPPLLATSPGNPNLLVAGEQGESPSSATIYDVSTGSLVTVASNSNLGGNLGDIEVSPDATKLYVSDGGVYHEQVYSTSDFSNVTTYSTGGPYPTAVALSADGAVLATGRNGSPDVYLYQVGGSTAYRTLTFADANGGYSYSIAQGGMAFSPDGGELFVLSTAFVGPPVLHIIAVPEKTPSSISIAAPATATRSAALSIHGNLSEFGGAVTGAQILAVTRQDLSGAHALPNVTTAANGSFSFGDTPPVGGPNTYTVSWTGDASHLDTSSHATVNVSRHATSISIATNRSTINYQQAITVTVWLRGTYNRRFVTIYAQSPGLARKAIKAGNVDSHGLMKVVAHPGRDTTFSAVFDGDYHYAPVHGRSPRATRASVSAKMLGWYANSSGARVYRHTVNPTIAARLSPTNKAGEKLCFPLQINTGGAWRTLVRKCFAVDSGGATSIFVYGSNSVGVAYRIRVEFAGDAANAAANSARYNFRFTT